MPSGIPKTKNEELLDKINALVVRTPRFLPADDFELRKLIREVDQLIKVDPPNGYSHLSALWQMTGDRAQTLRHIDNAIALDPGCRAFQENKGTSLAHLGYFSEAQEIVRNLAAPEFGYLSEVWELGHVVGAFQTLRKSYERAQKMNLVVTINDTDLVQRGANVLDSVGATDVDVARVLDVFGGVLRDHRLFHAGEGAHVGVIDEPGAQPFIEFTFDVDVSPIEAHKLYLEFVDRSLELPAVSSVVTIHCRSWGESERSAA